MKSTDLQLIRSTFEAAASEPEQFAKAFRRRAIVLDPSLATEMPEVDAAQAARTALMIGQMVDGLDLKECSTARSVALRHSWASIQPNHYGAIGQALLDTLASRLGSSFSDSARRACADAFILMAETLMARRYNPLGLAA